jgi:hypothetical protein
MRRLLVGVLAIAMLANATAQAQDSDAKEGGGVRLIQLLAFMAPTRNTDTGKKDQAPITITLEVPRKDQVEFICRLEPRLRDALLETLFTYPIPMDARRNLDFEVVRAHLLAATNRALRRDIVTGVLVETGVKHVKTSGSKFAGAVGCRDVR